MSAPVIEERHGFPGALRALGGVGGHLGAPHVNKCAHATEERPGAPRALQRGRSRVVEERHGFPGALRTLGGVGGHLGAPHVK